ncbi:hypothetical protein OFO99_35185, partial [Escherichia coli]|nr:hypothetical protein [Escherichia coli]
AVAQGDGNPAHFAYLPQYDDLESPSWGPDGVRFVFVEDAVDQRNQYGERRVPVITVIDAASRQTRHIAVGRHPAWSVRDVILYSTS